MKWFRKTFVWASMGCVGATASASAQPATWQPVGEPATVRPAAAKVSLGWPTPLAAESLRVVNNFEPIEPTAPAYVKQASFVVRGMRPMADDEPKTLTLPKTLPPLIEMRDPGSFLPIAQPVQAIQPPAKDKTHLIDIETDGKVVPKKSSTPKVTTPAVPEERVIILEEGDGRLVDENGRSLFGLDYGNNPRLYARGEFLLWATRGFNLPALVLTASPNTPLATRGILGVDPTAQIIYGNNTVNGGVSPGGRFTLGYNLDPCGWCTLEGSFFFLGRRSDNATFNSNTTPVIGRPFFDLNDGVPSRELTTSPDQGPGSFGGTGSLRIATSSNLYGADVNLRSLLWCGCNYQITGLVGYRYLNLSDQLSITENTLILRDIPFNPPDVPVVAGTQVTVFDRFSTRNQFNGGQFGAAVEWQRDRWTLETTAKLGLGVTQQSIDIFGSQRLVAPNGTTQTFNGGLYALPSNSGHHTQSRFGVVPEIGIKLGYDLTDHIRLFVGYDFLYWNSVVRPGDQIDQVLDLNQVPQSGRPYPPANQVRPIVPFRTTSYYAHGVNLGIEIRY